MANGTPRELKQKSETAGAVTLVLNGVPSESASSRLAQMPSARRATLVSQSEGRVVIRVLPKQSVAFGQLARDAGDLAQRENWRIEELHTEEGKLDEVFRAITISETKGEQKQ